MQTLMNKLASSTKLRILTFCSITLLLGLYLYQSPYSLSRHTDLFSNLPEEDVEIYKYPKEQHPLAINQLRPKRVAVIGAGASGSAAAFFLRRAARVMEERIGVEEGRLVGDIVVFDKEGYVGGRSTTVYAHGDDRTRPIELGASIFVESNRHMVKAAKLFNLTMIDPDFGEAGLGIWDGHSILYQTSLSRNMFASWWNAISAAWRYGPLSPIRTNSAVNALLSKFANLYDHKWLMERGSVESIEDFADVAGLGGELTNKTGDDWAVNTVGVGLKWMAEIMEGSTRVNYASDMNSIHALGSAVSMATGGAKAVQGGNWRVFDAMLRNASTTMHLGTEVKAVLPYEDEYGERLFQVVTNVTSKTSDVDKPFDVVFFAAPWHLSPLDKNMHNLLEMPIPKQKYVHLHVTLLATDVPRPDPGFFGLPNTTVLPTTILTSGWTSRNSTGIPPPRFQSITWHGETFPGSGEYVVKIFSLTYLNDKFLKSLLGGKEPTWLLRKEWDSYPALAPNPVYAPVEPIQGMQYLAAMEPWVSTMETQTLSAREAVARVVAGWWGLGLGECRGGADAWDWSCGR